MYPNIHWHFIFMAFTIYFNELTASEIFFSSLDQEKGKKFSIPQMAVLKTRSRIECTKLCHNMDTCKSVNFLKSTKTCEILDRIPVDLNTLTTDTESQYLEKSAQPLLGLTTANYDFHATFLAIYIAVEGGITAKRLLFNNSYYLFSIEDAGTTKTKSHSIYSNLKNVALLEDKLTSFAMEDMDNLLAMYSATPLTGFPKATSAIFGPDPAQAFIAKLGTDGFYAFTYDKVMEFSLMRPATLTLDSIFHLDDESTDNLWRNAPKGVIAAAWIHPKSSSPATKAFLATNTYYAIFDTVTKTIIKRDQLV
ncbi:uncharacterized protein LOC126818570 [Patella vulgata]|uniref:uncharacterized protein LOC126818570 n=1 Tax=Patella vulgata TaxID=6465 RepID=UPI00217F2EF5|nr:uncharacterized protein LOC126818570 [Patella vulgata]